ncbi:MAG: hypothetical protein Q9163_004453 [Psora crenata]
MPHETERILPLPSEVAAKIKSSTAIPSLESVVLGLVENALDAQACKIDIRVNFAHGTCSVEDDGHGIAPQEFMEDGGLGKPCTSRYNSPFAVYGRQGMFLASVAALSILTITSHHDSHSSLCTLILHHSRPAARLLPAPPRQQLSNPSHGTRVTVHNLFGNMPVRIKQRAVAHADSDRMDGKNLALLKKKVTALLLSCQRAVSVTLTLGHKNHGRLNIRVSDHSTLQKTSNSKNSLLLEPASTDPLRPLETSLVCGVLSQAKYIEPTERDSWIVTSARTSAITAKGAISVEPAPSKQVQFISLGIRPIYSDSSGNVLYDEINRLFAASRFGNREDDDGTKGNEGLTDRNYKRKGCTNRQLKGTGKGVDRWPKFYIQVELNENNDIERLERENLLSDVMKVIGAMISGFLKSNHFRPLARVKHRSRRTPTRPTAPLPVPSTNDAFSCWSRIKCGKHSTGIAEALSPTLKKATSMTEAGFKLPGPSRVSSTPPKSADQCHTLPARSDEEQMLEWINPISKATVLINSRTGLALPKSVLLKRPSTAPASLASASSLLPARVTRRMSVPRGSPVAGSWASQLISKWENPVFALAEQAIPRVALEGSDPQCSEILRDPAYCCSNTGVRSAFTHSTTTLSTRLSKKGLEGARIISQVDKKFILVSMGDQTETLVLVDQHAADERVRVEALIDTLSTQVPAVLQRPISFEISAQDQRLLEKHGSCFEHWGFQYKISKPVVPRKCNLTVTALPESIAERCRGEPKVLIELLRSEAWKLEETTIATPLRTPPKGILDLLNSRACRSAIMFNDPLSIEDAETLIRRLAQTKMPFQCAHGRPSMVPLLDLGEPGASDPDRLPLDIGKGQERKAEESFGTAWKRWRNVISKTDMPA